MPIAKYAETQRHWVENNPEYYSNYYNNNKRKNWDASNKRRRYITEAKRLRNILLEIDVVFIEENED